MSKGEVSIVGTAAVTCLTLFLRLQSPEGAMARPTSAEQGGSEVKASADPCGVNPCITFVGNLRAGDNFLLAEGHDDLRKKDKSYFFKGLAPLLDSSSVVFGNLETPFVGKPTPKRASRLDTFWTDRKTASALEKVNITTVSLANRHMTDFGDAGLEKTISALEERGIRYLGVESSVPVEADGQATAPSTSRAMDAPDATATSSSPKVEDPTIFRRQFRKGKVTFDLAVFNAMSAPPKSRTAKWRILDFDITLGERIADFKSTFPQVFAVAYLGNAPVWGPATVKQQQEAHALIDAGADLVVGYGSRYLQEVERYNGKWIVYGLGDAVTTADLKIPPRNERWPFSGALRLVLTENGDELVPSVRLYPILNDVTQTAFQPRLLGKQAFGDLFWYLLRKERIEYDYFRKMKMHPGMDTTGRFISLRRGTK